MSLASVFQGVTILTLQTMTLTKQEKKFSIFYVLIIVFEQLSGNIASLNNLHFIAKPLIVISLMSFFWFNSKKMNKHLRRLFLMALFFSLFGDIFLMFTNYSGPFFMLGLCSFLIAHLMYILVFSKQKGNTNFISIFSIVIIAFATGLFSLISKNLEELLIPVVLYILVIMVMVIFAYLRKGAVDYFSFTLVLLGALFFLVSDSLIALNKFYNPLAYPKISIMITYAIAQYCIVIGFLKNKNNINIVT